MVKTKKAGLKITTKKSSKIKKNNGVSVEEKAVLNVNAPKLKPEKQVNTDFEVLELEKKVNKKINKTKVTKNKKGSRSRKKTKDAVVEDSVDAVVEDSVDTVVEDSVDAVVEDSVDTVVEDSVDAVVEDSVDTVVEDSVDEDSLVTTSAVQNNNEKEEIVDTDINLLGKNLLNLTSTLTELLKQVKNIQNDMKVIQKQYNKVSKEHEKMLKKKRNSKNNKPSGFAIPSSLSDEMLDFLGLEKGIKVPRNEVLKLINKYIVENELRQEEDKRNILPDKKLKKLLNVKKNDKVTYFNLQSYLKPHFIKT
jgi:upstream activation factor subunit UAF30